jgi:hypothetical protein
MRALLVCVSAALVLALLAVPLFTGGRCTAEFDTLADRLEGARPQLLTLTAAQQYLSAHALAYRQLTGTLCEQSPPKDVETCPPMLLWGSVPVRDPVCRYYRDSTIRFQLAFNSLGQLIRLQTDMNPYRKLRFPGLDWELQFAR